MVDVDKEMGRSGAHTLILDLVSALSTVKALTEIHCEVANEKTVIRQALSGLLKNQDMERCSFFVVDSEGVLSNVTGLSILDSAENLNTTIQSRSFRVGEGIIGTAAATGEIQYCPNCQDDPRFSQVSPTDQIPGSIVCVPVFTLHQVLIGVLNVSHPNPEFFTDWHLRLLSVYTNILGQLITNRRLFQHMEAEIALRTAELERLVAETRQLKDHYVSMSMHDQLTGLHNRRYFYDQIELALAQHKRYEHPFCLLVLDIDFFKTINDQYGHQFGDQVLINVAEALKQEVRNTDILVRFGGEEFVVIFSNTGCENGRMLAERIRSQIKSLSWVFGQQTVNITISIGLHCLHPGAENSTEHFDIDHIINCADIALYVAKENGRDRVEIFTPC